MKAKWKGEENGNSVAVVWDTSFRAGEWVDVSHLSAASLAKLSGNHFFEVEGGEARRKPGRPPKAQQEQPDQTADEV